MPNPVDIHVGRRVRQGRVTAKMSQTALAEALGITFQQVQKYEKGINRVSASKLFEIAQTLGLPVDRFFQGLPATTDPDMASRTDCAPLVASNAGIELIGLWPKIMKAGSEHAVLQVARLAAGKPA